MMIRYWPFGNNQVLINQPGVGHIGFRHPNLM